MKKKYTYTFVIFPILILATFIAFLLTVEFLIEERYKAIVIGMGAGLMAINFIFLFVGFFAIQKRREVIARSFDFYVENTISSTGVGLIAFDDEGTIIWVSELVIKRISKSILGRKLISISPSFKKHFLDGESVFKFEIEGATYNAQINVTNRTLVIKDITREDELFKQYSAGKLVLGEIEIDNFQQYQLTLSEEELFKVQAHVIKMLDDLVIKYNIIYRQYTNGKYIIITNSAVLDKFTAIKFSFLNQLRSVEVIDGIQLSASLGFGQESPSQKELLKMAKDGLLQSQARGGDQVTLISPSLKPKYYGSKSQIAKTVSKVKINKISLLLENKLKEEKIKRVIIYGHRFADLDATGAALGVAAIVQSYGKEVFIQNKTFDSSATRGIEELLTKDEKKLFIKTAKAKKLSIIKGTMVIIVDTAEISRIENPHALNHIERNNIFVFDHHRASDLPDTVLASNSYIDTSASSACEIVTEVIQFVKKSIKLSPSIAQSLLNGIYLDTLQFRKSTSSRTFQAAAYLETFGASSDSATEILKVSEENSRLIQKIVTNLSEVKPGYFIATYDGEVPPEVISIAADEILRTKGREAAFAIARIPGPNKMYKLSARSIETNVQKIVEEVGGGGHFEAAAAVSEETLDIFKDNIIQAIISRSDE